MSFEYQSPLPIMANAVKTSAMTGFSALRSYMMRLADKLDAQFIPKMKAWFTRLNPVRFFQSIGRGLYRAGQAIVRVIVGAWQGIKGFFIKAANAVKTAAGKVASTVATRARGIGKTIRRNVARSKIRRFGRNTAKQMKNAFAQAKKDGPFKTVYKAGKAVVRGVDNAYITAADKVVTAFEKKGVMKSGKGSKWKRKQLDMHTTRVKRLANTMEVSTAALAGWGIRTMATVRDNRSSKEEK